MSTCPTKYKFIEDIEKQITRDLSTGETRYLGELYDKLRQLKEEAAEDELTLGDEVYYLNHEQEMSDAVDEEAATHVVSKITPSEIAMINANKPIYKGAPVTVVDGRVRDNQVTLSIKYKNSNKIYYNIDADVVRTDQIDIRSSVLFASSSDKVKEKAGEKILAATGTTSKEAVLKVFDNLAEIDNIEQNDAHNQKLREILGVLAKPAVNAAKEVAVYLDKKAKRNNGYIEFNEGTANIYLSKGLDEQAYGGEMTLTEKYVHEMLHAATYWAFRSTSQEAARIKNRLIQLHKVAMKKITPEVLMPEVSINKKVEREVAEATYKYINSNIEEFLAYAVTNEKVMALLSDINVRPLKEEPKGFVDKLVYWIGKLVDFARDAWKPDEKNIKADILAIKLTKELMDINNEVNNVTSSKWREKINLSIDKAEDYIKSKVDNWVDKQVKKAYKARPVGKGKIAEAVWAMRTIGQLLMNPQMKGEFKSVLSKFGLAPEGSVQTLIQKLKTADQYENVAEDIGLASLEVDKNRENMAMSIDKLVSQAFKKLNKKTNKLLYNVLLKYDAKLLVDKYEKDVIKYFKDEGHVDKKIAELTDKLEAKATPEEMNYYNYQIAGLVKYLKTGEGSLIQLKNAEAIALMAGTQYAKTEADPEVKELIDEIVSTQLIKELEPETKKEMANALETEYEGIVTAARMQKGFETYLEGRESEEDRLNRRKGYVRETYDAYTLTTVAPVADRRKMENNGYKMVEVLAAGPVGDKTKMALYVSSSLQQLPFNRSGVRYTGEKQQGRTLFEHRLKAGDAFASDNSREDVNEAKSLAADMVAQVMKGNKVDSNEGLMPHLKNSKYASDFRYTVKEEHKLKYMKISQSVGEAIGRSWAHQVDVEESQAVNEAAWEEMMLDMGKNYRGGSLSVNGHEYVLIDANSPEASIRDIARILPEEFKDKLRLMKKIAKSKTISNRTAKQIVGDYVWNTLAPYQREHLKKTLLKGHFAVRRDMLNKIFGFRDLSIVNGPLVKKLPKILKTILKYAENGWKEIVSLYSVDVVIKTLAVPVENLISNFWQVVVEGHGIVDTLKAHVVGWKGLNQLIKDDLRQKELIGLMHAYPNEAKYKREYDRIEASIKLNPVTPLRKLYQHIMEDVGTGDFSSSSRLANWMNAKMENTPEIIKTGVNYLFVTEKTGLFRAMQKFVMFGDFVARYAQYSLALNKEIKKRRAAGKPFTPKELEAFKRKLIRKIIKSFVNYADPDAAVWQYIQDIGIVKFSKYAIGIQNVIREQVHEHPIRFVGAIALQDALEATTGYNPDTIDEKSILAGHGLFMPGVSGIVGELWENKFPLINQL